MSGGLSSHFLHSSFVLSIFLFDPSAHLFVPTLAPIKHDAQDRSRTALWRRPKGLSLNERAPCYARTIMRVRGSPGACVVLGAFVVSRSSVESMARAKIASPYIPAVSCCGFHGY